MTDREGQSALWSELDTVLAAVRSQLSPAETGLTPRQRLIDVLMETIDIGIVFCDAEGGSWVRNRAERDMLGLGAAAKDGMPPEAVAKKCHVLNMDRQRLQVDEYPVLRALRGEEVGEVALLLGPVGGPYREVVSHSAQVIGENGVVLGAVSTLTDVTTERFAQRALAEEHGWLLEAQAEAHKAETRFRNVFHQSSIGAVIMDLDGLPTQVNAAACALLARPPELLVGTLWSQYFAPGQLSTAELVSSHLAAGHDTFGEERRYLRPDGTVVWVSAHFSLVRDEQGESDYLLAQLVDITERKRMEADLDHQAVHDALTGLPNRLLFAERVRQAIVERPLGSVTVAVLLLAGLRAVIDKDGYDVGDLVLKQIADRLTAALDDGVTIGHLQPGQFALLVQGSTHDSVSAAERALTAVGEPIDLPGGPVTLRASVGICAALPLSESEDPGLVVGRLIQDSADAAGRTKAVGSDAIAFASPELRQEQEHLEQTELLIREALDNDTVRVAYQPVVDLATGLLVGAEALLRISDRSGRSISPQDLIPAAEESGLIVEIGLRVLRLAAEQAAQWLADCGVLLPVAVNVSAVQLKGADFIDDVLLATKRVGLPTQALTIELTESVLLDSRFGIEKLRELHDAGIHLAIDDFGTGYASLSYLRDLPASTLKIDRSFVEGIPHDRSAVAIVAAVIGLAHNFGMTCIAEGIETEAQRSYLAERRVHGQGYLLGRPGSGAAISKMLQSEPRISGVTVGQQTDAEPGDQGNPVADQRDTAGD